MTSIEDRYLSHLAYIESAVADFYRQHPDMTDAVADSVYEELAKRYRAEATAHEYKAGKLDGLRLELHDLLLPETEALVGRGKSQVSGRLLDALKEEYGDLQPVSAEEVRQMLVRLRKSIQRFGKQGRTMYLQIISRYIPAYTDCD